MTVKEKIKNVEKDGSISQLQSISTLLLYKVSILHSRGRLILTIINAKNARKILNIYIANQAINALVQEKISLIDANHARLQLVNIAL